MDPAIRSQLVTVGQMYMEHAAKFKEFIDAMTAALAGVPSLEFGQCSETEAHFSFTGRTNCFRLAFNTTAFPGSYAVMRLEKSLDEDKWLPGHAVTLDDMGNITIPGKGKGSAANDADRIFYYLMTGSSITG